MNLLATYTEPTVRALEQVRNPDTLNWSIVVLIGLVVYIYAIEIQAKRWPVVFAGLGFFCMDVFNETINALVLHFTNVSAIWTTTGGTAYQPLVGWNVEIIFLFSFAGIAFVKVLPKDRDAKLLGINNRLAMVTGFSIFAVLVELLILRAGGLFHWHYWWWGWPALPLIVIFGYMTFFALAAYLYDLGKNRRRQFQVLGTVVGIDAALIIVCGLILGWL